MRTIVLADDHAVVRAAFRTDLEEFGFVVCAEAHDAAGAVEASLRHRPSLCLLDIHMPGDGLWAARRIAQTLPETKVVMLTIAMDSAEVAAARRAGAAGYVLKDVGTRALLHTLEAVFGGRSLFPDDALRDLND